MLYRLNIAPKIYGARTRNPIEQNKGTPDSYIFDDIPTPATKPNIDEEVNTSHS